MSHSITLLSPCKINLFLYVLGKRPDGFHDLQSLFCLLDHGDTMSFSCDGKDEGHFSLSPDMGFAVEQNLIYKAVQLLRNHTGRNFNVAVHIEKILPMGGGLGGGSSNAATTLLTLNKILDFKIPVKELELLGAKLGSDVPFFIRGHNAFVEGRGEVLHELDLDTKHYLVVTPKVHVSTKDVFTDPELKAHYSPRRHLEELLKTEFSNDCVSIVRKKFCEVGQTLDSLIKYGSPAMSGTGASCFVAFATNEEAVRAKAQLDLELEQQLGAQQFSSFVAASSNISPTLRALSSVH